MYTDDDIFDERISAHDRYQFEMKLDYKFHRGLKRQRYIIETYLFIPPNLGIHSENYSSVEFYRSVQNYIRFKTPVMGLEQIVAQNDQSLLTQMERRLRRLLERPSRRREDRFIYEGKLLACVFRSALRENIHLILDKWKDWERLSDKSLLVEEIEGLICQLSERVGRLVDRFRQLGHQLFSVGISERVRSSYQLIDEFLSLTVETYHYQLLERIDRMESGEFRDILFRRVRRIILEEERYRRRKGYLSVIDPEDRGNALFLYRHSLIKKYVSSILFLETNFRNPVRWWNQVFYAIAAGIAMFFATVVGFYAQAFFPNFSLPLLFAFVVIYMFKDRLKDFFREFFSRVLSARFYDRRIEILDPSYSVLVGFCREKFSSLLFHQLPVSIQELRRLDSLPALNVEERGEAIFQYRREVDLHSMEVFRHHERVAGLNDIFRFNIRPLLFRMDDPYHRIPFVREGSDRIHYIEVAREYHLNVIFCFHVFGEVQSTRYRRLRVVLNQEGILRVEQIDPEEFS